MLVLSTKPLQKLSGTDGQAGRQADSRTGKPMCREAAPPKIWHVCVSLPKMGKEPKYFGAKQESPYPLGIRISKEPYGPGNFSNTKMDTQFQYHLCALINQVDDMQANHD